MREGLRYGQTRHDDRDGTTAIKGVCKLGGHMHEITVPTDGLDRWLAGDYVQTAMPTVPTADREFLISASCGPCFDKLFGSEEEEEPLHLEDRNDVKEQHGYWE